MHTNIHTYMHTLTVILYIHCVCASVSVRVCVQVPVCACLCWCMYVVVKHLYIYAYTNIHSRISPYSTTIMQINGLAVTDCIKTLIMATVVCVGGTAAAQPGLAWQVLWLKCQCSIEGNIVGHTCFA